MSRKPPPAWQPLACRPAVKDPVQHHGYLSSAYSRRLSSWQRMTGRSFPFTDSRMDKLHISAFLLPKPTANIRMQPQRCRSLCATHYTHLAYYTASWLLWHFHSQLWRLAQCYSPASSSKPYGSVSAYRRPSARRIRLTASEPAHRSYKDGCHSVSTSSQT